MNLPRIKSFTTARRLPAVLLAWWLAQPSLAHASIFQGEALDTAADVLTWIVLVVAPLVGIAVFWIVHILPEKIAEKKKHPQTHAIQCLCLLSLFFGGLLWPIAWLWAYSKPVMYKLAYGTDVDETVGHAKKPATPADEEAELNKARAHVAELESKAAARRSDKGKA